MKIWVAEILNEGVNTNSCSVELFKTEEEAIKWAEKEIDNYCIEYNGYVTDRNPYYYSMQAGECYVSIEIEEKSL